MTEDDVLQIKSNKEIQPYSFLGVFIVFTLHFCVLLYEKYLFPNGELESKFKMDSCKSSLNNFCYVCGHYFPINKRRHGSFSDEFKSLYTKYFDGLDIITDQWYVPKHVCKSCYNNLLDWKKTKGKQQMNFKVPMFWSMPSGGVHDSSNFYACENFVGGQNKRKMKNYIYKEVPSAQIPIPHTIDGETNTYISYKMISPDVFSICTLVTDTAKTITTSAETEGHSLYDPGPDWDKRPKAIPENEMDKIVAELGLTQRKSERLTVFLKGYNVLDPKFNVTEYRKRQQDFQNLYNINVAKTYAYCSDAYILMLAMFIERPYNPEEWRLFIDSSKNSLKVVLLHVSNKVPSIPLAYSTETKETHEVLDRIMKDINYDQHQWKICCDLKVVTMLCGLQSGRTKHMCFLCKWVSTWKKNDGAELKYTEKKAEMRTDHKIGKFNVKHDAIIEDKEKILFPVLHIKLGIVKNFIKRVYKEDQIANSLKVIFPGLSEAKLSNGMPYIFLFLFRPFLYV